MKTTPPLLALLTLLGATSTALAADGERPVARPNPPLREGGDRPEASLTEAQRDQMRALEDKIRAAQRELQETIASGLTKEKILREKSDAIGKLESDRTFLHSQGLVKAAASRTGDQPGKPREARPDGQVRRAEGEPRPNADRPPGAPKLRGDREGEPKLNGDRPASTPKPLGDGEIPKTRGEGDIQKPRVDTEIPKPRGDNNAPKTEPRPR